MRLSQGGLIDRAKPLRFSFDGKGYQGFAGDTLASALLANDVRLVGRSFKYHRPRGILTADSNEPNALMTIRRAVDEPNVRATTQELYEGLEARSQNAWPALGFDLLGMNDLLAPFLGAGFYYKTFMWPKSFWERVYEPFIRRAAGLGALSKAPDRGRYDKAFAHCDLLVIGGGPAGLMAALVAGRAGADVILADEDTRLGGRLLAEREEIDGGPALDWVEEATAELRALPNVRLMTRTTVTGAYDGGTYGALERVSQHLASPAGHAPIETFWRIVARRAILAAGAHERPIAFPNNDRPGVMLASAVRAYVNRWGVAPGKRVAVFGQGADAERTARDLRAAGVELAEVITDRVTGTNGRLGLEEILVPDGDGARGINCDCLAVAGGWNPAVHLTCHMGARPVWRDDLAAFVPAEGAVPGLTPAGACAGAFSTAACLSGGARVAGAILEDLGLSAPKPDLPEAEDGGYTITPIWHVEGKGRAWLDFQNDVTVKDVKQSATEGFRSVEHMKRYTTQGMATDQGKNSNVAALAVLADATGRTIPETGTTTFRPPYTPINIAALGAGALDKGFAPERHLTSHAASVARGAPMIEAGLWYRPSYFPAPGEQTWREACDREVTMVRQAVGVADVSTLGKIDIQGPDAGKFLDFVYTNTFSTLKEGRVRYGLMLREDGHVMDDGTTARLGAQQYLMTTTTAAAGQVMAHLDWVRQALMPGADVQIASVTEHWAQFAVAGPKAGAVLASVLDDWAPGDWPFMSCGAVSVSGVAGRLFRISFSGEQGYEIAVPARFGESLFRLLVAQAEALGGGPYGMEALNVLRIEKGFITHAEIHGRVTAFDIGMGRMVSAKKDCVGKTMSERPGLSGPEREQMVGLKPAGSVKQLTGGAHLFEAGARATAANSQGYVTSVGFSPTLGCFLGQGFLRNGRARHGETVRMVDHVRGVEAMCEVCDPVFYDPEGGRMRG
ncbi:Sarcosine oxidase alpha subunit [Candidatus Rhodobacter oscarellae]|uniref:Sarcosine oxidase alpha subunit n=1 Tax=Candidatus Rhodobacter oscarellae TaxID=1675527 RepID=A0A0J9E8A3_9RHOB|nr:2Fe-2S iron-sulfur cluster-binding protein [Candidatus Rhodobacter lobularis]KMW57989.1 Sarcosine oxidase alpha subunit [Candidatus Rhodobacter lobularis]